MLKIGFLGGGNMARAIVAGLVASGIPGDDVTVMDRHPEKLAKLNEQFGVRMQTALGDWVSELDIVVLAVTPQGLKDFCLEAASHISAQTTVLSIAAAVPAEAIVGWLGTKRLVRAMPNTPAMVVKESFFIVYSAGVSPSSSSSF